MTATLTATHRVMKVMIICGGFLNEKETSVARALRKQLLQ